MRTKSGLSLAGSASRPIRRSSSDSNFSVTIRCRDGSAVVQGSEVSLRGGRVSAFQPGTGMIGRPLVARERTLHLQKASKGLLIVFFRGIYLYRLTIVGRSREAWSDWRRGSRERLWETVTLSMHFGGKLMNHGEQSERPAIEREGPYKLTRRQNVV